jgi:hypothetical protein
MTDKYQALRDGMPELQREAARKGGYNPRAPLIIDLLAERDALQAECEKLRAAMIEAKSYIEHYMYGGSSYREPAVAAIELIDDAMQEANP